MKLKAHAITSPTTNTNKQQPSSQPEKNDKGQNEEASVSILLSP